MPRNVIRTVIALLAFPASVWSQTPAGGEFRVNTYTTSWQLSARAAMEPDGDFVVVWASYGQDGSQYGVFGQRFAASGAPRGSEFQVNTYTWVFQYDPAVAVGSRGDFVVVWTSDRQDDSSLSIHGQRYDAAGSAIGGEFQVNNFTVGTQYHPRVGRASDGGFVVTWTGDRPGATLEICGRRFDASGSPIGSEFVVNTYTTGYQHDSDVAVQANGNFVVTWVSGSNPFTNIFGQRYDDAGNRLGSEFQVNSSTTGYHRSPSVSVSRAGGFVVAWVDGDGSGIGMVARRFDASGNAVGNEFAVNTYTPGSQYGRFEQVAHDALGNFVVTWTNTDWNGFPGSGHYWCSMAQRFSASGARRGTEFCVNAYTTQQNVLPSVASDSAGNVVVVWHTIGQGGNKEVFGRRLGGLAPSALAVDSSGNRVLEPGETVDVRPTWHNINGAAQTFGGTLTNITGPAGATYAIADPAGDYGTVADGTAAQCTDCYVVSVSDPATRPAVHWDASAVESIVPDTQGQQKQWLLHVGRSFDDVSPASGFYRFVETLLHRGVTAGCVANRYCPTSTTTREQMAVFVLVSKEAPGYSPAACGATPLFPDVPVSSPFCRWVEELARRGVVSGCGGGNYCPTAAATREQMAVFVLRTLDPALNPPACVTDPYTDVPTSSPFCRWILELTNRGVVTGCGGGNYCPAADVSREQMSVFLAVTFGLTLYGL